MYLNGPHIAKMLDLGDPYPFVFTGISGHGKETLQNAVRYAANVGYLFFYHEPE